MLYLEQIINESESVALFVNKKVSHALYFFVAKYARVYFHDDVLHEKALQRHIGACILVSSQERRALLVSLINRG